MLLLAMLLSTAQAVPLQLHHQARLLDSMGVPLSGSHTLVFKLYRGAQGGSPVWTETLQVPVDGGYIDVELGNVTTLSEAVFDGSSLFLGLTIDGGAELPRQPIGSVPYAMRAATASSVAGGVVDATEIRVNGETVIDGDGVLQASISGPTLGGLSCAAGQIPEYSGTAWRCATPAAGSTWGTLSGIPAGFADGVDNDSLATRTCPDGQILAYSTAFATWGCVVDRVLTEAQVDAHVGNNGYARSADLAAIATTGAWSSLTGIPLTLADGAVLWSELGGIPSTLADGAVAWSEVAGIPSDLADGTVDWGELESVPSGFSDGIDDVLSEDDVVAYVEGGPVNLDAGSTLGGHALVRGDQGCAAGQVVTGVSATGAVTCRGRNRIVSYLASDSEKAGTGSWQYQSLNGKAGPYTITTTGKPVRIYFKAMTYVYAHTSVGDDAGLIIHPVIDGVRDEYCDYLYVRGWGTHDNMHGPIVCDYVIELPAGTHTIGFEHRYFGYNTILYGGSRRSLIIIEELVD